MEVLVGREELIAYAADYTDSEFEPETTFMCEIMVAIDIHKFYVNRCRTKTLVVLPTHNEKEFIAYSINFKKHASRVKEFLAKEYGPGNFKIINEELAK